MPQLDDNKLKDLLIDSKVISKDKLNKALELSKNLNINLREAILQGEFLDDITIGSIEAKYFKLPFISLLDVDIPDKVLFSLPEEVARNNNAVVFDLNNEVIKVGTCQPSLGLNYLVQNLKKKTGKEVDLYYVTPRELESTLSIYKKNLQYVFEKLLRQGEITTPYGVEKDPPIEKLVDLIIETSYLEKASDVHIEPQEKVSLVRFRIDGILHDVVEMPQNIHDRVVTRIKVMSGLRTDEHQSAQDGKIRKIINKEEIDLRVSIVPIVDGEKVVIRILAGKSRDYSLSDLGMSSQDLVKVKKAIARTYGMILSTGPTGSGKTTSIYSILKVLSSREKNIMSIEDPVEYRIKGANQIQVNPKTNLTFASGLRAILRQDPDIVFVGEIRDNETAGIAVNAALTGHLVLSTLHTNNAATAIPRLIDMKVEPFLVASTVNIVIAQRLLRRICANCRSSYVIPKAELAKHFPADFVDKYFLGVGKEKNVRLYKGTGCKICGGSGYVGRIGVFEVLEVSSAIRELITNKADSDEIQSKALKEGMITMLEDAVNKMSKGLTTMEEILRVVKTEGE